jgi:hypothetical protein
MSPSLANRCRRAIGALGREATWREEAKKQWEREHPPTPPGAVPSPGEGAPGPLGGAPGLGCEDAAVTGQEVPGCAMTEEEGGPSSAEMAEIFGCTGDHTCVLDIRCAVALGKQ